MNPSLAFDKLVDLYDETRAADQQMFDAALDYLRDRFPPHSFPKIVEPGIGTGRIAIPLAGRGYSLTGIDLSGEMLSVLRRRSEHLQERIGVCRGDASLLPFRSRTFDLAIAVHLFYFIGAWRRAVDELLRVLRPSGCLVLMHTGWGKEVPLVNEKYAQLIAARGAPKQLPGVRSTSEVIAYCRELGCRTEEISDRWQWTAQIRLDDVLRYVRARAYSFTTAVPPEIHESAVVELEAGLRSEFGTLASVISVPNQIKFAFVHLPTILKVVSVPFA